MDKWKQTWQPRATTRESKSQIWADGYNEIANRKPRFSVCSKPWFSLAHKHKHKHKHMCIASENWVDISISILAQEKRTSSFFLACTYAYVVALTSENWVEISTSISTTPWTNHRPFWTRPHANIPKAIWRTKRPPSCLPSCWGELVSRIESNMLFCACVCPYAYAYALVKTRLWPNLDLNVSNSFGDRHLTL